MSKCQVADKKITPKVPKREHPRESEEALWRAWLGLDRRTVQREERAVGTSWGAGGAGSAGAGLPAGGCFGD